MSHLTASSILITDLEILKKAVAGFGGLKWNEGAKTFRWYVNSNTEAKKQAESEFGTCEHSISIEGAAYQVGVVRRKDGEGYNLVFDPFDAVAAEKIGYGCEKITAAYAEEFTRDFAARNGFMIEESTNDEGDKVLTMIDNG